MAGMLRAGMPFKPVPDRRVGINIFLTKRAMDVVMPRRQKKMSG
jgi:hypothetical protein